MAPSAIWNCCMKSTLKGSDGGGGGGVVVVVVVVKAKLGAIFKASQKN